MCELLGVSAKRPVRLNDLLREFFSHAEQHPHGWGLARFSHWGTPFIEKEPVKATTSAYLAKLLAAPIEEPLAMAHIRLATVGDLDYRNCHPFAAADNRGRVWTLAHNGTLFRGDALNGYLGLQYGDTDSERILLHLLSRVNDRQIREGRPLAADERFEVLEAVVDDLAGGNKLNLLVYDGETLYAHVNFRDSLHYYKEGDALFLSTRPLVYGAGASAGASAGAGAGIGSETSTSTSTSTCAHWRPVPFTRLVAVKDGEIVREGHPHGKEYFYNPEDYRLLYVDYASL